MAIHFSEFYRLDDLFNPLEPMQATPWDGRYEKHINNRVVLRDNFDNLPPILNINNYLPDLHGSAIGFFIIYSTFGPYFRVGFFNNNLEERIRIFLSQIIASRIIGINTPIKAANYAYKRYLFIHKYKKLLEYLNDIYISIAKVENNEGYNNSYCPEIARKFKEILPMVLPNGEPIIYFEGTAPNNNNNLDVIFQNNLKIEENIYL